MVIDQTMGRCIDFAVQQTLYDLIDRLTCDSWGKTLSTRNGNDIYVIAALKHAANHPYAFRSNGFNFGGICYYAHKKDAKGKLVSVKARFEFEKEEEEL